MKICITGYSGFLGKHLSNYLAKKFNVVKVNLRKLPQKDTKDFNKFLKQITKSKIIINCAANLNPKNENDFFINESFPKLLQSHIEKSKSKALLIHISSINVLLKDRSDHYTISKRKVEKKLLSKKIVILRLPFLYKKTNGVIKKGGSLKIFFKYLDTKFLPVYPMIYPGHIHRPVEISKLSIFIFNLIKKKNIHKQKIYNIVGKDKISLWDLFSDIAFLKKKKIYKLNTKFIRKILPNFILNYFRKSLNLQMLLSIDNSNFKEKKIIL